MDATNDRFVAREMSSRHPHRCAHRGPLSQDGDDVVVERLSLDELRQSLGWPVAGRRPINNTPLPPPRLGALVNGFYNKKGDSPSAPPWPGPIRQEETVLFALIERSQFPAGGGGRRGGLPSTRYLESLKPHPLSRPPRAMNPEVYIPGSKQVPPPAPDQRCRHSFLFPSVVWRISPELTK